VTAGAHGGKTLPERRRRPVHPDLSLCHLPRARGLRSSFDRARPSLLPSAAVPYAARPTRPRTS
jgi:hypothetical protein